MELSGGKLNYFPIRPEALEGRTLGGDTVSLQGRVKLPKREISLTINGREYRGEAEPRKLLADFIRDDLGLTGTHVGCEHGVCGACTVLMDNEPVRSCLMFAVQANGADLKTVEGLAPSATELHPLQQTFWELHGLQCGFCTPGILLTAEALLREIPNPSDAEIREWISGNLCRCTGYQNIVAAIQEAAQRRNASKF
jgi:aerobic-type carbon monoxide dehydrogenase small subunit (CoxS/CutS family)